VEAPRPFSIRKAFEGRHVLIAGGSGFLGKVWLAMLLERVPEIGKLYVLLRRNSHRTALDRFESMINSSYVFKSLHDRHGDGLSAYLSSRVEVLEGNVTMENLGIPPDTAERLQGALDLFINCAGLVDFNPDVRDAVATNVDGALKAGRFTARCRKAALLHISTCFVCGAKDGMIPETVGISKTPKGDPFHPEKEYEELKAAIDRIELEQNTPDFERMIQARVAERIDSQGNGRSKDKTEKMLRVLRKRHLRESMIAEGMTRAQAHGWPNTYTYTKALAEALLTGRYPNTRMSMFRPSIVESSLEYPFPGWNEGFNTSGPLAYLLRSWFRFLPAKIGNPFDIIPVDLVAVGMTIAGAQLMEGKHHPVYQCGTSDSNLFTIDRACELTALGHRTHLRKHGSTALERLVLSRWEAVPVPENYLFSLRRFRKWTKALSGLIAKIPSRAFGPLSRVVTRTKDTIDRVSRRLAQVDVMLELFKPFIHDNKPVFECKALREAGIEEPEFRFEPARIKWREYWLLIHMPGLRRWCFPAIEGKDRERLNPERPVRLEKDRGIETGGRIPEPVHPFSPNPRPTEATR
jgi:NAD(P)-dependent dehydrogenase (short-subunit alcohol dehydrogenase family)